MINIHQSAYGLRELWVVKWWTRHYGNSQP